MWGVNKHRCSVFTNTRRPHIVLLYECGSTAPKWKIKLERKRWLCRLCHGQKTTIYMRGNIIVTIIVVFMEHEHEHEHEQHMRHDIILNLILLFIFILVGSNCASCNVAGGNFRSTTDDDDDDDDGQQCHVIIVIIMKTKKRLHQQRDAQNVQFCNLHCPLCLCVCSCLCDSDAFKVVWTGGDSDNSNEAANNVCETSVHVYRVQSIQLMKQITNYSQHSAEATVRTFS